MRIAITLDITNPHQKYLHLKYAISDITDDKLVLTFPTWAPGSYMIRDYQSQIDAFEAKSVTGKPLTHKKINKCQWQIATRGLNKITVTYRVYASELNVRAVYADHQLVFVNGAAAYFHIEKLPKLQLTLKIKTPPKWQLAAAIKPKGSLYYFDSFDALYDTPLLCARELVIKKFSINKTDYQMAFWGQHTGNLDDIARDVKKIVHKQIAMFKGHPCKNYLFQVLFLPKMFGGLEHAFSSSNIFDGSLLANKSDTKRLLSLLSHEHFHLWNVKRIRPSEFDPFDYKTEVYTRELWMAEGITSFYDDHFVYRAGLYTKQEYLDLLAENITKLEASKATRINSISDSSFDAWIRFYRPNENSLNTVVSYYLKGGLVMLLLDAFIAKASHGRKSLDDVMRALYKIYVDRPKIGITRAEFLQTVRKTAGKSAEAFFKTYIDGTTSIDWKNELANLGVTVKSSTEKGHRYLGVVLAEANGKVVIQNIAEDSPAYQSTLQAGDELIAINSERITATRQIDAYLQKSTFDVTFSRLGQVYATTVSLNAKPNAKYALCPAKKLTKLGKVFFRTS